MLYICQRNFINEVQHFCCCFYFGFDTFERCLFFSIHIHIVFMYMHSFHGLCQTVYMFQLSIRSSGNSTNHRNETLLIPCIFVSVFLATFGACFFFQKSFIIYFCNVFNVLQCFPSFEIFHIKVNQIYTILKR